MRGCALLQKSMGLLLFAGMLTLFLAACHDSTDRADAIASAKAYKEILFNIKDYNHTPSTQEIVTNTKPYLTNDFMERRIKDRALTLPVAFAISNKVNMKVNRLKFKEISDKENETILNYKMSLIVANSGKDKEITLTGVMNMTKIKDRWKVSYDHYNVAALDPLSASLK